MTVAVRTLSGASRNRARPARLRLALLVKGIVAVCVSIVALFPIWWMVCIVFSPPGASLATSPRVIPTSLIGGFDNIAGALSDPVLVTSLLNSVLYSTVQSLGTLLICSLAAYEFAHGRFVGQRVLLGFCLLGLMVPFAVSVLPLQRIVAQLGWLNTIQGITVPLMASGLALFLLAEYMRAVPRELFEAARVDGLTRFGMYWRIALPLTQNGLVAVGVLVFITSWSNYLWPLLAATDPNVYPVSVAAAGYFDPQALFTTSQFLTVALLSCAPLIVIYVLLQRWIVDSIARVGVRG